MAGRGGGGPARGIPRLEGFLVKDHPMLTPQQTMATAPALVMISYQ